MLDEMPEDPNKGEEETSSSVRKWIWSRIESRRGSRSQMRKNLKAQKPPNTSHKHNRRELEEYVIT